MYREVLFSEKEPEVGSKSIITYNSDGKPGIYDRKKDGTYVEKYQRGSSSDRHSWLEYVPDTDAKTESPEKGEVVTDDIKEEDFELAGQMIDRGVNLRMPDALNEVREFHKVMNHPVLQIPTIPSAERTNLRVELLQEELNELKEAIEEHNIIKIADALCDLQYVLSGAVLEFGLGEKFKDLFDEVQRSNMSKTCSNMNEVEETISHYSDINEGTYWRQIGDKFVVYRSSDNKVMKNKFYSPADLKPILIQG